MDRRLFVTAVGSWRVSDYWAVGRKSRAAEPITIRVVTPFPVGHVLADTAFKFKQQVESKSKGKILVNVATSVMTEQTIGAADDRLQCQRSRRRRPDHRWPANSGLGTAVLLLQRPVCDRGLRSLPARLVQPPGRRAARPAGARTAIKSRWAPSTVASASSRRTRPSTVRPTSSI